MLRFARYSGVHMIRLAPASGGMLQLIDSTQAIHGDGALVRDLPSSHDRKQASPRFWTLTVWEQVYGCCWLPDSCVVSCSFYNKSIRMSRWT